jgi:hypothetical protein
MRIEYGVLGLTSGLAVGDRNDQDRFPQLILSSLCQDNIVDYLLPERGTHRREAFELNTPHDLFDLGFSRNIIRERSTLLVAGTSQVGVHETK